MRALHRTLDQLGTAIAAMKRPGWRIEISRKGEPARYVTPGAYVRMTSKELAGTLVRLVCPDAGWTDEEETCSPLT